MIRSFYRQKYYEAIDLIVNCIENRFNQPGYKTYCQLETLLLGACKSEEVHSILQDVCEFYKDDFDSDVLCSGTLCTLSAISGEDFGPWKEYHNLRRETIHAITLTCPAVIDVFSQAPSAVDTCNACYQCLFREIIQCIEEGKNLFAGYYETGQTQSSHASSCAQGQM